MIIYMGEGVRGGPFRVKNHIMSLGNPRIFAKQKTSSELPLAFVIMSIITNNNEI